jgi:hypothetical protein
MLTLGLLLLALACGASPAASAPTATSAPVGRTQSAPPTAVPPIPTPTASVRTGSSIGERVPDFQMQLADGSVVTSASLLSDGKPVFLFFFATW